MNTDTDALGFGRMIYGFAEELGSLNGGVFSSLQLMLRLGHQPPAAAQVQGYLLQVLLETVGEIDRRLNTEVLEARNRPINLRAKLLYILGRIDGAVFEVDLRRIFIAAFQNKPSGEAWFNAIPWLCRQSGVRHGVQKNVQVHDPKTGSTILRDLTYLERN